MTATPATAGPERPALPHWEEPPADLRAATREIKAALRERIAASGRDVAEVFAALEQRVLPLVEEIETALADGVPVWPEVQFADIADGTVPAQTLALIKRRGCAVVRGTFSEELALQWDQDILDYVERNAFFETYRGPGDDFFSTVGSKPEIYPIYWSSAQMEARTHPNMAAVQGFLNGFWTPWSQGRQWFDPSRDSLYPDRIRRRPPGTNSSGLGTHLDAGTLDLWMTEGYQRHFRHLFDGTVEQYDPWDPAYRTEASQYPGSTMCSAFRTFQGWTALSAMAHDQGVLHVVPIPEAMAYLMLRPLLEDVADDDMCGVTTNKTFPANQTWHAPLLRAVAGIPDVAPGDTVWWHCDMIHGVAPVTDQQGWGNVMYIPAAPWCAKNEEYAAVVRDSFRTGASPSDFPQEDYEATWEGRFPESALNETGKRGMGLV